MQCERCNITDADQYYWHGDIQEDYDMGEYNCLCESCFDHLTIQGDIKWITHL